MKKNEEAKQFSIDLARLAMRHKVSPALGMMCFGHLGGLMIVYEQMNKGGTVEELREVMLAMFTDALDRGIADGTKMPPPMSDKKH